MCLQLYFLFILGLLLPSFLNVVIYRKSWKKSFLGHSKCENCKHNLNFLDLIPLLSWIYLSGKCRYCKHQINKRHLIFESIFIIGWNILLGFCIYNNNFHIWYFLVFLSLYFFSIYDILYQFIPAKEVWICIIMSLIYTIYNKNYTQFYIVLGIFLVVITSIIFTSYKTGKNLKQVFGLGDILILIFLSFWFSWFSILQIICISSVLGIFAFMSFYKQKRLAFVPFISIASFIVLVLNF